MWVAMMLGNFQPPLTKKNAFDNVPDLFADTYAMDLDELMA